jgi:glycosyltransferase involved in cell wall biosynthesis
MEVKISVVTPSFNHAEFLEATIQSVVQQHYPNLQYIIVDGGSTDQSVELLKRYRDHVDVLITEPDNGQTDALIKGFNVATGDVFAWLNSDDLYEPNTLLEVAEYFDRHPEVDFIYGNATWIDWTGRFVRTKKEIGFHRFIWLYAYNYIPQPSAFWRKSLYEAAGGLDAAFELAMDTDLFARFAQLAAPVHVHSYWSKIRTYPEQKNRALRARSDLEDLTIRRREGAPGSGIHLFANRALARTARVMMKTVTGAYFG